MSYLPAALEQHVWREYTRLLGVLSSCDGNMTQAAQRSGIPRRTFYRRVEAIRREVKGHTQVTTESRNDKPCPKCTERPSLERHLLCNECREISRAILLLTGRRHAGNWRHTEDSMSGLGRRRARQMKITTVNPDDLQFVSALPPKQLLGSRSRDDYAALYVLLCERPNEWAQVCTCETVDAARRLMGSLNAFARSRPGMKAAVRGRVVYASVVRAGDAP